MITMSALSLINEPKPNSEGIYDRGFEWTSGLNDYFRDPNNTDKKNMLLIFAALLMDIL